MNSHRTFKIYTISVLLQLLLFSPLYFTRKAEGSFFPIIHTIQELITRPNPDVFRCCLEWSGIMILFLILNKRRISKYSILLISLIYLFLIVFQWYYFILWKIYGEIPVFRYDFALFERVLPVFIKTMGLAPVVFYSILFLIVFMLYYLFYKLFEYLQNLTKVYDIKFISLYSILFFILPLTIKILIPHSKESNDTKSAIVLISENIYQTFTSSRIHTIPDSLPTSPYTQYSRLDLKSRPNIFLIFIEAYGSILASVPPYDSAYISQLKQIETNFSSHGWHAASALSNSTILGGRSWLGFTSLISGIHIDNHPAYEKIISKFTTYPHLIQTLNNQGYHTYRLNTMANFGKDFKDLDSIAGNYFHINAEWTRYNHIPYQGYKYDYFGGIPDQYALNYWYENVLNKSRQPYFLFFITLNTHAPFYLPPPLVENWKDLDDIKTSPHKTVRLEKGKPIERYAKEVKYILTVLEQFILQKADSNSLFILVGDHQPAGMEYMLKDKTDVYANPMHIITKDKRWITLLKSRGFNHGMVPEFKKGSLLSHEGFYSFFMNTWADLDSLKHDTFILKNGISY